MKINKDLIDVATTTSNGLMSASDKKTIDSLMLSTSSIQENLCTVFKGSGVLPKHTKVEYIDKKIFGIYTVLNDSRAPVNIHDND